MSSIRPAGSGRSASCGFFLRPTASPQAGLVIGTDVQTPSDWPTIQGTDAGNAQLGHALGWVCEVRQNDIVVLNPLGEGAFKVDLPPLDDAWLHQVRSTESTAIYIVPYGFEPAEAEAALVEAAATAPIAGASVRTAVVEGFGQMAEVGRNEPCPCGSGRKYKKCHGS
jgi:hypothetical protein